MAVNSQSEHPGRFPYPDHPECFFFFTNLQPLKKWLTTNYAPLALDREPGSHRGEYFPEIRFRGSPIRFATKITTRLLWDVTGSFTCVVICVEKSYFPEILDAMRLALLGRLEVCTHASRQPPTIFSHRTYVLINFRKLTPPQNRHLNILISNSK